MKALSLKIANIYLLSILFVPWYISAAVRNPQRRQNYSPSGLLITPASTTRLTIANRAGSDTVTFYSTMAMLISSIEEAPAGPTFSSVVPIFTLTPGISETLVEASAGPIFTSVVPIFTPTHSTLAAPNGRTASSVGPVTLAAPTTYPTKSGDDHSISTTGLIITQSVTPTMISTTSFTIQSLTPAATSTASAAGTSGARSVGSKHTWSAIVFLPWLGAMLTI